MVSLMTFKVFDKEVLVEVGNSEVGVGESTPGLDLDDLSDGDTLPDYYLIF
jgi:hypothetical protein